MKVLVTIISAILAFQTSGYIRFLSKNYYDKEWTQFLDMRARFKLKAGEDVSIHTTFDILDNVMWGFNYPGSREHPIVETVSFQDISLDDVPPVKVKHLFLSARTRIGLFRIGLQPSHWGLGISQNAGEELWNNFGDSFFRVLFVIKPVKPLITGVFADKVVEGPPEKEGGSFLSDAETEQGGIILLADTKRAKEGLYSAVRWQPKTSSYAIITDIYGESKGKIYLALEIVGIFGEFFPKKGHKIKVRSLGAAGRIGLRGKISPVLEIGWASPEGDDEYDPQQNPEGTELKAGEFDPDYDIALILFETKRGGKVDFTGKPYTPVVESRYLKGEWYVKGGVKFGWGKLSLKPQIIVVKNAQEADLVVEGGVEKIRLRLAGGFTSDKKFVFIGGLALTW